MSVRTWWCAIDRRHCSYQELKERGVVAQGWPLLGDLSSLLDHVPDGAGTFKLEVQRLGDGAYSALERWTAKDRQLHRGPAVLWNLVNLGVGDLVVGLEGQTVCGVCELTQDARQGYRFESRYRYAHGVGPVGWTDWSEEIFGFELVAPAQSVHGIKALRAQHQQLVDAWERHRD